MQSKPEYDSVFLNSRREAIVIFLIWLVAMLWTVPYCYLKGFTPPAPGELIETVAGIPAWVFWGIGLPWMIANVATISFCLFIMRDDDLGFAGDEHSGDNAQQQSFTANASNTHAGGDS